MAISRFSNPANQEILDTYVPIPFAELSLSLRQKQAELDQAKEQEYQLRNLAASLKADPLTNQYVVPEVMEEYTSKLNELSEKIAKGDDIGYKQEVGRIARQWINDPRVKAIKTSRENYEKYQEDAIKNKDKMVDFYDPYRTNFAQSISQYQPGSNVPIFNYEGMKYRQDYVDTATKLMSGIAKDGMGWENYSRDKQGNLIVNEFGQIRKTDGSWEKIDSEKVLNIARVNTDAFLSTDEGRYFVHELLGADINYEELPPEIQQQVKNQATNLLYNIGSKQIFNKSSSGENLQNLSEFQLKSLGLNNDITFNRYEIDTPANKIPNEALNRNNSTVTINGKEVKTGIPEESKASKFLRVFRLAGGFGNVTALGAAINSLFIDTDNGQELDENNLSSEDKRILDIVKNKYNMWNPTKKQLTDAIQKYGEEMSNKSQSSKINVLSDIAVANDKRFDQSNEEFNQIMFAPDKKGNVTLNGAIANLKVINASTGETLEGKELVGKVANTVGALSNNNPYGPGWRQVQANGKTYYIPGSDQEAIKNEEEWSFHQTNYNLLKQSDVPVRTNSGNFIVKVIMDEKINKGQTTGYDFKFIDPRSGRQVIIPNVPNSEVGYQYFKNYFNN